MTFTENVRCVQHVGTANGVRQCSRTATHYLPSNPHVVTCTQHARVYDVPMDAR